MLRWMPIVCGSILLSLPTTLRADWPQYRGDAARTGNTEEALGTPLYLAWDFDVGHEPQPAWPRDGRMGFDRAMHPVAGRGMVFFGSSVDGKVYALDAKSGAVRWTFPTDAPVRFAPALWQDRLLVASDDGCLYALSADNGELLWRLRGGPTDEMVLGNGRMVSRWPARGGPVVLDDTVYFAAGIWPSDGIYVYAVDPASGDVLWKNDKSGGIEMPQPHGGAHAKSGISAQGYLLATEDKLFVPTGRAVPAALDRATGEFIYYHLQRYGHQGGTSAMADGGVLFNGGLAFDTATGDALGGIGKSEIAATSEGAVISHPGKLRGYRLVKTEKPGRKGKPEKTVELEPAWTVADVPEANALVVAGNEVVAGCDGRVLVADAKSETILWSAEVAGKAHGLAVSDGSLIVSTDQGHFYRFTSQQTAPAERDEVAEPGVDERYARSAEEILRRAGFKEGYCLDLQCGDGQLAQALAERSDLYVYAVESNAKRAAEARARLTAAGLYGTRVMVHHAAAGEVPYAKYFANLIVSGRSVCGPPKPAIPDKLRRWQRPHGGTVCLGPTDAMTVERRGALAGAGEWTHQYSDAANTLCSDDRLVKGPLRTLWFCDVDHRMPQRHGRGPAPLFADGLVIVEGLDGLQAIDAYNGRPIWKYKLPGILEGYDQDHLMGASGTGSNFCYGDGSVFVRQGGSCLRIDAKTGEKLDEFPCPKTPSGKPGTWGYLAYADGRLFGSVADTDHVPRWTWRKADMSGLFTESSAVFAVDPASGEFLWKYEADDSLRHNAVCVAAGKVFLVDRPLAKSDRVGGDTKAEHPTGKLLALDASTGDLVWSNEKDIYGTMLAYSAEHDALLMSYQPTRFRLPSERGGRMAVLRGSTGERLWDQKASYASRPLINGQTIYAQGGAWDLLSGEAQPFPFQRSYGCGILAGSKHLMLFRSATLGYFDLTHTAAGTKNFGGIRPGCWVNALPVGGIVVVPDASAGCVCSYQNRAWIALEGAE